MGSRREKRAGFLPPKCPLSAAQVPDPALDLPLSSEHVVVPVKDALVIAVVKELTDQPK
jgi:hypothetical protein